MFIVKEDGSQKRIYNRTDVVLAVLKTRCVRRNQTAVDMRTIMRIGKLVEMRLFASGSYSGLDNSSTYANIIEALIECKVVRRGDDSNEVVPCWFTAPQVSDELKKCCAGAETMVPENSSTERSKLVTTTIDTYFYVESERVRKMQEFCGKINNICKLLGVISPESLDRLALSCVSDPFTGYDYEQCRQLLQNMYEYVYADIIAEYAASADDCREAAAGPVS